MHTYVYISRGKDKALPNEKKILSNKHRRNDGIRNSLVENNTSLMRVKVSKCVSTKIPSRNRIFT